MTTYNNETMTEIGQNYNKELIIFKIKGSTIDDKTEVLKYIIKRFRRKCKIYALYYEPDGYRYDYSYINISAKETEDTKNIIYPIRDGPYIPYIDNPIFFALDYNGKIKEKSKDGILDGNYIRKLSNNIY